MKQLGPLMRVVGVELLAAFTVRLTFSDGTVRAVDLSPYLKGPIFDSIRDDPQAFQSVRIAGNTVAWENGADIDPDVLYYELTPANQEQAETAS